MSDGSDFSVIWNEIEIGRQIDLVYVRDYGIPKNFNRDLLIYLNNKYYLYMEVWQSSGRKVKLLLYWP